MGIQNLWVLEICLYSNFGGLNFVGTHKNCGNSNLLVFILKKLWNSKSGALSFVGTQNLWVHTICDDTKFQVVAGKIRTYVFSANHVNRKTHVLFLYMLFAICSKTYHVN